MRVIAASLEAFEGHAHFQLASLSKVHSTHVWETTEVKGNLGKSQISLRMLASPLLESRTLPSLENVARHLKVF